MKFFEDTEKEKHMIHLGKSDAKVNPLSVQLYSEELAERSNRDEGYRLSKMNIIAKEYNNLNKKTHLRLVGEWLWDFVRIKGTSAITSYDEISRSLGTSEISVRMQMSKLNYWNGFPFTFIPVPKKAGFVQLSLNNEDDYERWRMKKEKIIVSNEQVKEKVEKITPTKRKKREKNENQMQKQKV